MHRIVVSLEVIGLQKKKDPSSRLVADKFFLLRCCGACEEQVCATFAGRGNYDPAFVLFRLVGVIDQREVKFVAIKVYCFVIVADNECDMQDCLIHRDGNSDPVLVFNRDRLVSFFVTGMQCIFWFNQDYFCAFNRDGSVFYAFWHDIEFAWIQSNNLVT
jgi:hypothetical protein